MARLRGYPLRLLVAALMIVVAMYTSANERICHTTQMHPFTPFALEMCYMHSHNSCCLSAYDQSIKTAYSTIIPGGPGCSSGSLRIHAMLYDLLRYLCLPCNPHEPDYRFESVKGDIVDGGIVPPSLSSEPGEFTWRICRSFLYGAAPEEIHGIWGDNASQYTTCGIQIQTCVSTPVFNIKTAKFEYPLPNCQSESELMIPSIAFKDSSDPALEMLSMVAQTMPDFQIVIVNDSDPHYDYDLTPCFGKSRAVLAAGGLTVAWSLWLSLVLLVNFLL